MEPSSHNYASTLVSIQPSTSIDIHPASVAIVIERRGIHIYKVLQSLYKVGYLLTHLLKPIVNNVIPVKSPQSKHETSDKSIFIKSQKLLYQNSARRLSLKAMTVLA